VRKLAAPHRTTGQCVFPRLSEHSPAAQRYKLVREHKVPWGAQAAVAGAGIWVSFAVIAGYQLGRAAPATSARRRVGAVILTKENKQRQLDFDSDADRQRNRIEQLTNRLKYFRGILTQ
jgi:hypothetical protein